LMKAADRHNAAFALILGESEIEARKAVLKDLHNHTQTELAFEGLVKEILNRFIEKS